MVILKTTSKGSTTRGLHVTIIWASGTFNSEFNIRGSGINWGSRTPPIIGRLWERAGGWQCFLGQPAIVY